MPSGIPASRALKWDLFDRVCWGESISQASVALGVSRGVGHRWWREAGGMELASGRRGGVIERIDCVGPGGTGHPLNLAERVQIMRGRDAGLSEAQIGQELGRHRSTIGREIARNGNAGGDYHALMAHQRAMRQAKRPKAFKLDNPALCAAIEAWMDDGWSPHLISEVLAKDFADDRLMQVSHETIYQCLYVQTRGQLRADLHKCLSTKRAARKSRGRVDGRRGVYNGDEFKISDRPAAAADRAVPGHWESQWCCQAA